MSCEIHGRVLCVCALQFPHILIALSFSKTHLPRIRKDKINFPGINGVKDLIVRHGYQLKFNGLRKALSRRGSQVGGKREVVIAHGRGQVANGMNGNTVFGLVQDGVKGPTSRKTRGLRPVPSGCYCSRRHGHATLVIVIDGNTESMIAVHKRSLTRRE